MEEVVWVASILPTLDGRHKIYLFKSKCYSSKVSLSKFFLRVWVNWKLLSKKMNK